MRYVVSFSGGLGSFVAGAGALIKYGPANVDLVFCDTLIEHPDLYRFLDDAERALNHPIIRLKDGRDPWDVYGVRLPDLYNLGFVHNNCGWFCVRAGQAQFALLLKERRDVYLWHEEREQDVLRQVPTARPFLRKTIDKQLRYIPLREFRMMLESGCDYDHQEWGGCGCFVDDTAPEANP